MRRGGSGRGSASKGRGAKRTAQYSSMSGGTTGKAKQPRSALATSEEITLGPGDDDDEGEEELSSLQDGSVQQNLMEAMWKKMEERLKSMEDREERRLGEVSVVGGVEVPVESPESEMILKENLRKFITAKAFPSWQFIFKKNQLGKCVLAAVSKSYITIPPGYEQYQFAERYSQMVRACLDGCRANAQTAARKRYLSK